MSFLDIDEILSEEERIPCIFNIDASNLGYLDSTNNLPDLPAHSKVELPLWLASTLSDKNMIEIELPKHYGSRIREDIMAGATAVPLREYSFYYFEVGWKLSRLMRDADLRKTLRTAFTGERYKALMARALAKYHIHIYPSSSSLSLDLWHTVVGMMTLQTTLTTSLPLN